MCDLCDDRDALYEEDGLNEARRRVSNGMEYLDETYPDHVERFDPDNLDINSSTLCVLAQASNMRYWDAMDLIAPKRNSRRDWAVEHGFMCGLAENRLGVTSAQLENAWIEAYESRRNS